MKKRTTIAGALLATGLLLAPATAFAVEDPQIGDTQLNATVDSTYKLTIPRDTEIAFEAESTSLDDLKVTSNVNNQFVAVTAQTNGLLAAMDRSDNATIAYTLKAGDPAAAYPANGFVWTEDELRDGFLNPANAKTVPLTVDITADEWAVAKAGTYAGSITFTATMTAA